MAKNVKSQFVGLELFQGYDDNEETGYFNLRSSLTFYSVLICAAITVPSGFKTNFASVPWVFTWLINPLGKSRKGACLHDFLYYSAGIVTDINGNKLKLSRKQCDKMYEEAMIARGCSFAEAKAQYRALRIGGFIAWHRCKRAAKKRNKLIGGKNGS